MTTLPEEDLPAPRPKVQGFCDHCEEVVLVTRDDDKETIVRERIQGYQVAITAVVRRILLFTSGACRLSVQERIGPLVDHYREQKVLMEFEIVGGHTVMARQLVTSIEVFFSAGNVSSFSALSYTVMCINFTSERQATYT